MLQTFLNDSSSLRSWCHCFSLVLSTSLNAPSFLLSVCQSLSLPFSAYNICIYCIFRMLGWNRSGSRTARNRPSLLLIAVKNCYGLPLQQKGYCNIVQWRPFVCVFPCLFAFCRLNCWTYEPKIWCTVKHHPISDRLKVKVTNVIQPSIRKGGPRSRSQLKVTVPHRLARGQLMGLL